MRIPREKPVKPTVIVENVINGLMWPFFRSVLPGLIAGLLKLTSRARCKCYNKQCQEENVSDPSVRGTLRSPEIRNSRVNHAAQVTEKERCEHFYKLVAGNQQ